VIGHARTPPSISRLGRGAGGKSRGVAYGVTPVESAGAAATTLRHSTRHDHAGMQWSGISTRSSQDPGRLRGLHPAPTASQQALDSLSASSGTLFVSPRATTGPPGSIETHLGRRALTVGAGTRTRPDRLLLQRRPPAPTRGPSRTHRAAWGSRRRGRQSPRWAGRRYRRLRAARRSYTAGQRHLMPRRRTTPPASSAAAP